MEGRPPAWGHRHRVTATDCLPDPAAESAAYHHFDNAHPLVAPSPLSTAIPFPRAPPTPMMAFTPVQ
jgi:hypothetical protein